MWLETTGLSDNLRIGEKPLLLAADETEQLGRLAEMAAQQQREERYSRAAGRPASRTSANPPRAHHNVVKGLRCHAPRRRA